MSMIDDAADETKDDVKKARQREQAQRENNDSPDGLGENGDTSGEEPVANLE